MVKYQLSLCDAARLLQFATFPGYVLFVALPCFCKPKCPYDYEGRVHRHDARVVVHGFLPFKMVHVHGGTGHPAAEALHIEKQFRGANVDTGIIEGIGWHEPKNDWEGEEGRHPCQIYPLVTAGRVIK